MVNNRELRFCVVENIQISSALAGSLTPVEIRPGVAVATVTGNLVVRDNTYTLNTLEDEEEGEITRVKRERDSGETDGKVYYSLFLIIFLNLIVVLTETEKRKKCIQK